METGLSSPVGGSDYPSGRPNFNISCQLSAFSYQPRNKIGNLPAEDYVCGCIGGTPLKPTVFRILRPALAVISTLMVSAAWQSSPHSSFPAFQSRARLVLLSFHVTRGKNYVRQSQTFRCRPA